IVRLAVPAAGGGAAARRPGGTPAGRAPGARPWRAARARGDVARRPAEYRPGAVAAAGAALGGAGPAAVWRGSDADSAGPAAAGHGLLSAAPRPGLQRVRHPAAAR